MTDIIELAKKCGARLCVCNDEGDGTLLTSIDESFTLLLLRKYQLLTFEAAIRQDQIEKDAKIANQMIMTSWNSETDAHNKCALEIRNGIRKQLPKQVQGD